MKKNMKGRPQKYTDEELLKILENYLKHNKGKLNFLQLENTTGIKRHVWSRRFGEKIKELNEPYRIMSCTDSDETSPLNIKHLAEQFLNNKNGLIQALSHFEDIYNDLLNKQNNLKKKNKQLNEAIIKNDKEIFKLKDLVKYYEEVVIGSSFPHLRRDLNVKSNLISINDKNKKRAVDLKFSEYSDVLE